MIFNKVGVEDWLGDVPVTLREVGVLKGSRHHVTAVEGQDSERRAVGWADLSTCLIEGQQGVARWMVVSFLSWFWGHKVEVSLGRLWAFKFLKVSLQRCAVAG